jgi:hypothetical protein
MLKVKQSVSAYQAAHSWLLFPSQFSFKWRGDWLTTGGVMQMRASILLMKLKIE